MTGRARRGPAPAGQPSAERTLQHAPDADHGTTGPQGVIGLHDARRIAGTLASKYGEQLAVEISREVCTIVDQIGRRRVQAMTPQERQAKTQADRAALDHCRKVLAAQRAKRRAARA